jgi:hypothetical protein
MPSYKKIFSVLILSVLTLALAAPVFAQTAGTKEPPAVCWTQSLCAKSQGGGQWGQTANSKKECGSFEAGVGEALGYCVAVQPQVNLQVKIGDVGTVQGLSQYVKLAYNYAIGIVSFIAIIAIMIGGVKWLTAGTGGGAKQGQEAIVNAVSGLFLIMGSYLLLQTVNPALTELKLPEIKKVRQEKIVKTADCDGKKGTTKLGEQCKTACDCEQGACIPMESGALEQMVKGVGVGTSIFLSAFTLGGGGVGAGAKTIYLAVKKTAEVTAQVGKVLIPAAITTAANNPVATAIGAYALYNWPSAPADQPGLCILEANRNVPTGGWCEKNEHCASSKCISLNLGLGGMQSGVSGGIGVCAGGGVGSPCECATQYVCADTGGCDQGLTCLDNTNGKGSKSCTDGKADSPCYNTGNCKDANYECKYARDGVKRCLLKGSVTENTTCTGDASCQQAGTAWQCVKGYCSDRTDSKNCCLGDNCKPEADCNTGFICSFYSQSAQAWKEYVADASKYQGTADYNDWLGAKNQSDTVGRLTQCKSATIVQ